MAAGISATLTSSVSAANLLFQKEVAMSKSTDFDFLYHDWHVHHRKLKTRLAGANDWFEFEGTSNTRPILGGKGNIEDNVIHDPTSGTYRATALRSFDVENHVWRIWWLDQRFPASIGAPVVGGFQGEKGLFITNEEWQGRAIKLRFIWLKDADGGPCWKQAFSSDGGQTWETNWVMNFSKL